MVKKIIFILILMNIIFISGCIENSNNQNTVDEQIMQDTVEEQSIQEMINKCENIDPVYEKKRITCYSDVSTKAKNISLCNSLKKEKAIYKCYSIVAKTAEDVMLCYRIEDNISINSCIVGVAIKKKDFSICKKTNGFFETICYNSIVMANGGNRTTCETFLSEKDKDYCYRILAFNKGKEYCDEIKDNELKESCKEDVS